MESQIFFQGDFGTHPIVTSESKKDGKDQDQDQESIQSSATPDPVPKTYSHLTFDNIDLR